MNTENYLFVIILLVISVTVGVATSLVQAQTGTDQDFGYWEYQMSPEGNVWQNDAQSFGYPAADSPSPSYPPPYVHQKPYHAPPEPLYYDRGRPTTVPVPQWHPDDGAYRM